MENEFSWLDIRPAQRTSADAQIMRQGEYLGKDKTWWTDGTHVWLRRAQANPATLERHDRFVAGGDYQYVETQDGVEVWMLQPKSQFYHKKTVNISEMNTYNVRRQAALAAVRRDWPTFVDVMTYLRERINGQYHAAQAEMVYTETYMSVMAAIAMRNGPSPGEINREVMALSARKNVQRDKIITIGRGR